MARCNVCFRHCELKEGRTGPCAARKCVSGTVVPVWYGKASSLALDPIEKKLILLGAGSPAREISLDLDRILDLSGDCLEDEE